jgi:hypothetical protein
MWWFASGLSVTKVVKSNRSGPSTLEQSARIKSALMLSLFLLTSIGSSKGQDGLKDKGREKDHLREVMKA